jgi:uridine phosphorylase
MPASSFPILEFDPDRQAIFSPVQKPLPQGSPQRCVLCFFQDVINPLVEQKRLWRVGILASEIGKNPIYSLDHNGTSILVVHPGVGAPLAAGFLEEMIQLGVKQFIACGGCGVLDQDIAAGHVLVIESAVRDEGTSYHYLPPGRDVSAGEQATRAIEDVLNDRQVPYRKVKSWTTDGLYRETPAKRSQRMAEGCVVVEMEASALFAVSHFRGVEFGQLVYGGDLVLPDAWDRRGWNERLNDRQALFWLAVEACLAIKN